MVKPATEKKIEKLLIEILKTPATVEGHTHIYLQVRKLVKSTRKADIQFSTLLYRASLSYLAYTYRGEFDKSTRILRNILLAHLSPLKLEKRNESTINTCAEDSDYFLQNCSFT